MLALSHVAFTIAHSRSPAFSRLAQGAPTLIVRDGAFDARGLRAERLSEDEAWMLLRMQEVADLREVRRFQLEVSGAPGLVRQPWAKEVQQADGERAREAAS